MVLTRCLLYRQACLRVGIIFFVTCLVWCADTYTYYVRMRLLCDFVFAIRSFVRPWYSLFFFSPFTTITREHK